MLPLWPEFLKALLQGMLPEATEEEFLDILHKRLTPNKLSEYELLLQCKELEVLDADDEEQFNELEKVATATKTVATVLAPYVEALQKQKAAKDPAPAGAKEKGAKQAEREKAKG